MIRLCILFLVVCFATPAFAQSPPSDADRLQMALRKLSWLAESRERCENALADVWAQAERLEQRVKALEAPKEKPDAPKAE